MVGRPGSLVGLPLPVLMAWFFRLMWLAAATWLSAYRRAVGQAE